MKKIWKKIAAISLPLFLLFGFLCPNYSVSAIECSNESFLGLVAWCDNTPEVTNEGELTTLIVQIILNILTDVSVLAAYLVLGFVIYGGYKYMFSYGDASKVAAGKKTLTNAFIGLAIVMLSSVIFSSIRIALIGNNPLSINATDATTMVTSLVQWTIGIGGAVAAIFVVYGGISYMTSSGDAGKLAKAKNVIINALIGLAIVALAEVITAFVSNIIRDSQNTSNVINNYSIAKELNEKTSH